MKKSTSPGQKTLISKGIEEPENKQVHAFRNFLAQRRHRESTIYSHINNTKLFVTWAAQAGFRDAEQLNYAEILEYVRYLKERDVSVPTINGYLLSIRKYYDYLREEGAIEVNPAKKIHIRGAVKKIITNPISFPELETLYQEYDARSDQYKERMKYAHLRRTVILGLMIFQAVHSGELSRLETIHVNLAKGSIYIPSGSRSNSRTLALDGKQIVALHRYMTLTKFQGTALFECNMRGLVDCLMQEVKGLNPVIQNAGHIRSSMILHWTKVFNKRQAQYMIGHRYISSIEKYQVQDLDSLTDALSKHHPFG